MSATNRLRILVVANHLLLVYALTTKESYFNFFLAGYILYILSGLAITIGYHRYWSHKMFGLSKFYQILLMCLGTIASLGPILTWAGIHRMHHAYEDTLKDPHSPKNEGALKIYFHIWSSYTVERKFIKDLISDSVCRFQYKYYLVILFSYITVLFFLFGSDAIFLYCLPAVIAFHSVGIVNSLNHHFGSKVSNKSSSTNLPIFNLLTLGESYHGNHHANSTNYDFGKYDFVKHIIKVIKK